MSVNIVRSDGSLQIVAGVGKEGTQVVANPILVGNEEEATSLQVGNTKYVMPTTNPSVLTPVQITLLETVLNDCVFADSSGAQKVNALIDSLRRGINKVLVGITATKQIISYAIGSKVSTSDIIVTAIYDDETHENVTSSPNVSFNTSNIPVDGEGNLTTEGTYPIGITYTENDVTVSTTIDITVSQSVVIELTSVTVNKTKKNYTTSETFSTADVTVIANYSDGSTNDVTSNPNTTITNNVDMTTAGTYSVNASYTEDGITKNGSVTITVTKESGTVIYTKSTLSIATNGADQKAGTKITVANGKKYKYEFDWEVTTAGAIDLRAEAPGQTMFVRGTKAVGATGHISQTVTSSYARTREPFILRYDTANTGVTLTNIKITEYDA